MVDRYEKVLSSLVLPNMARVYSHLMAKASRDGSIGQDSVQTSCASMSSLSPLLPCFRWPSR